jgi:hypothetical protein
VFRDFKEEDPALHRLRSEDLHTTAVSMPDTEPTLSELVAEIMHVSTTRSGRYFIPPPEARFISNRNVSSQRQAPMKSVTPNEQATGPFDINLDSTTEGASFSTPPFTFVSGYISAVQDLCI